MMALFSFLLAGKLKTALEQGAEVIDIRVAAEYDAGHVPGSHNIPVDRLQISLPRIKGMGKVVICGAGDQRNAQAVSYLKRNGMDSVLDGGSWQRVYRVWKTV